VSPNCHARQLIRARSAAGFSLAELTVSAAVTSVVSVIMVSGMMALTNTHTTISNRTELHAGVRGATELLQHEVSQAGRIQLTAPATLHGAVAAGTDPVAVTIDSTGSLNPTTEMFVGEELVIDTGGNQETVTLTSVDPSTHTIQAVFATAHLAGVPVTVEGGFGTGIVPPTPTMANGSTPWVLKLYGDIHGTGRLVYVEYNCDTAGGNLYRTVVPITATTKPALSADLVLLNNIVQNPGNAACFTYQQKTVGATTYVIDVAITLTINTQFKDPLTGKQQQETKALLNVSPRNVFETWQQASLSVGNRNQPMPASVQALLP
jgi:hypothetical protein